MRSVAKTLKVIGSKIFCANAEEKDRTKAGDEGAYFSLFGLRSRCAPARGDCTAKKTTSSTAMTRGHATLDVEDYSVPWLVAFCIMLASLARMMLAAMKVMRYAARILKSNWDKLPRHGKSYGSSL